MLRHLVAWRCCTYAAIEGYRKRPRDLRRQARQWAEKALNWTARLPRRTARSPGPHSRNGTGRRRARVSAGYQFNPSYPMAHIWYAQYLWRCSALKKVSPRPNTPATGPCLAARQHLGRGSLLLCREVGRRKGIHAKGIRAGPEFLGCEHRSRQAYLKQGCSSRPSQHSKKR